MPGVSTSSAPRLHAIGAYADGQPFDEVRYLQSKLTLKPHRFTSVEAFHDFGRLVKRTARETGVDFEADPHGKRRPRAREILFIDTRDFRLYNHGFILRRRVSYVDGFPVGEPEIVFKFRHEDERLAAAVDVRPRIQGSYRIKLKAQLLPLSTHLGGHRVLYSHSCKFPVDHAHEGDRTALATLARVFPALASLRKSAEERVTLVNEGIVEELVLPVGTLDFGKGMVARSNVALWRTRGEHRPLVGEFSFQIGRESAPDWCENARARVEQFFVTLQHRAAEWIALGTTKTGLVYRLRRVAPAPLE
jgi:hypothetical protein